MDEEGITDELITFDFLGADILTDIEENKELDTLPLWDDIITDHEFVNACESIAYSDQKDNHHDQHPDLDLDPVSDRPEDNLTGPVKSEFPTISEED